MSKKAWHKLWEKHSMRQIQIDDNESPAKEVDISDSFSADSSVFSSSHKSSISDNDGIHNQSQNRDKEDSL